MTERPAPLAYVVMGEHGEYSDRNVWPVGVFAEEAEARQWAEKATVRAAEISQTANDEDREYEAPRHGENEFDPAQRHYGYRWDDTTYFVEPVWIMSAPARPEGDER